MLETRENAKKTSEKSKFFPAATEPQGTAAAAAVATAAAAAAATAANIFGVKY